MPSTLATQKADANSKLVEILLGEKHLDADTLGELRDLARREQKDLLSILQKRGFVNEEDIARARGKLLGVPYVDLFGKVIRGAVLNLLPRDLAENYQIVSFNQEDRDVSIAMVDPTNFKALEAIEFLARKNSFRPKYFIISLAGFRYVTKQYATLSAEVQEALATTEERPGETLEALPEEKGMEEVIKTAPVSKMLTVILRHAVEGNASDIHIEPVENETRVRYRIDGVLHTSLVLPKYVHSALVSRIKVLSNLKLDETRIPQDGRFRTEFDGRPIDYRVSTLPLINNEKVVMRILDRAAIVLDVGKLGFEGKTLEIMTRSVEKSFGMIMMTGPTGSGKSTTLAALLTIINDDSVNIVTLEDPVEYYLAGINQSQVRPEVGFSFASGLRSILRQDPDIIMVGEIRDNETAELAVHAALTGHLVFTTLHTNDAFGAIPRFIDMKIEPFLIASSLTMVAAQRLVRKICQYCKGPIQVPKQLEEELLGKLHAVPAGLLPKNLKLTPPLSFQAGKGCVRCENTGYKGRTVIAEVLEVTKELQRIIVTGADIDAIRAEARRQGMLTMEEDGIVKALEGKTSIEEVIRATQE